MPSLPMTDLNHVLTTTRSVRLRLDYDRPVPLDIVGECLQLAVQAPSGGDAQDWRWVVVADPQRKAAIADLYLSAFEEYVLTPLTGSAGTGDEKVKGRLGGLGPDGRMSLRTERILRGAQHLAANIGRAPYLVLPCATRPDPAAGGAGTISALYGSVYPAIWSFNLALRARGLGTCLTSLHLHHAAAVGKLLGVPEDVVQVTLLPVAYTVGTDFKVAARKPVAEVAYLDAWGSPLPYADKPVGQLIGEEVQ